jgi:hypothetical protein
MVPRARLRASFAAPLITYAAPLPTLHDPQYLQGQRDAQAN